MQSILQQAQTNPAALQDHMKNPMIQQKIIKLVDAGIIKMARRWRESNKNKEKKQRWEAATIEQLFSIIYVEKRHNVLLMISAFLV